MHNILREDSSPDGYRELPNTAGVKHIKDDPDGDVAASDEGPVCKTSSDLLLDKGSSVLLKGEHCPAGSSDSAATPCETSPGSCTSPSDTQGNSQEANALSYEAEHLVGPNEAKLLLSDTPLPVLSTGSTREGRVRKEVDTELARRHLPSSSASVCFESKNTFETKSTCSKMRAVPEFRRCGPAGMNSRSGSGVSFLDVFHERQRNRVSSELKRRDEALHTLKHWRGSPKPTENSGLQQRPAAATSAGPPALGHDAASRRRVIGEMAALFSNLSLTKQQRAAASCKQSISQLEQQRKLLAQLIQRLSPSASVPKARGALVKARSLQLQMQQEQRKAGQNRRLPPHLLLPLPSLCSRNSKGEPRQDTDPWRRLLRRVRPVRRRASLPPSIGLWSGSTCFPTAAATQAAAAAAAAVARTTGTGTDEKEASSLAAFAVLAESAAHDAAAAAVANDFSDRVDRFADRQRTASVGWRGLRRIPHTIQRLTTKEWTSELMQQAEVVSCSIVAFSDAPGVWQATVVQALETLSRMLHVQMVRCQQRLELASLMEERRASRGVDSFIRSAMRLEATANGASLSSIGGSKHVNVRGQHELPTSGIVAIPRHGRRQDEPLHFSSENAPPETQCPDSLCSPSEAASSTKTNLTSPLDSEYVEDDGSLLEAETDCEYLLGRRLQPYERMLLKYRMLRRNAPGGMSASHGEFGEAQLVEELLKAVEDASTLSGEATAVEDEADLWTLWGSKGEDEAAKIEHLLGIVGELQQADIQQHHHVQQSLLPSQNSMPNEERVLRSFFEEGKLPDGLSSSLEGTLKAVPTSEAPCPDPGAEASDVGAGGVGIDKESQGFAFPTAQRLYRAHFLLGPWRGSLCPSPPHKQLD